MSPRPAFGSMNEYFAASAPEARPALEEIRRIVKRVVPDATETISYQMPAFKKDHVFIYFGAFRKHIGIYPPVRPDPVLDPDIAPYRGEKGNLKFPLDRPMPYDLIARVVKALSRN